MGTKYLGPERRKYLRLDTVQAVSYIKLSKDLKPIDDMVNKALSKDISSGGIRLITHEKIPQGALVEIQLKIPGTNKSLTGIGKITRIEQRPDGKSYESGLAFIWLRQNYVDIIDAYVRREKLEEIERRLRKEP